MSYLSVRLGNFFHVQHSNFYLPTCCLPDRDESIQNYNFICCFVWMWNLVFHITGRNIGWEILFGRKGVEVRGNWKELHYEELHNVSLSGISREIKIKSNGMGQACGTCGGEEKCNTTFYWRIWRKGSLEKSWRRWKHDIQMGLRGMGWEVVELVHLVHDRDKWWSVMNTVTNLRVPLIAGIFFN